MIKKHEGKIKYPREKIEPSVEKARKDLSKICKKVNGLRGSH